MLRRNTYKILPVGFFVIALAVSTFPVSPIVTTPALAQDSSAPEPPIYTTWQLMDETTKRHFLAGYLYGFQDARALGDIAIEFIKTNPSDPVSGLKELLPHYSLSRSSPNDLVPLLNQYFRDPKNRNDSLRVAIGKIKP